MDVFILGAKRTPIGSFQGSLAGHTAAELGGYAISAAVEDSGIDPVNIDEILMVNIGSFSAPLFRVKQTDEKPDTEYCVSGLQSVCLGKQNMTL